MFTSHILVTLIHHSVASNSKPLALAPPEFRSPTAYNGVYRSDVEPGHRFLAGSGRVTGQCVRPGV